MRKVAFIKIADESRKVMIYQSRDGVSLFGYDCIQDTGSKWDNWYVTVEDAENYCQEMYDINQSDWISIAEPKKNCQVDFIIPTKRKGGFSGSPLYDKFQSLINGKWREEQFDNIYTTFDGLTGNERLFITGLMEEFDEAMQIDKEKARKILTALQYDTNSIERIIQP